MTASCMELWLCFPPSPPPPHHQVSDQCLPRVRNQGMSTTCLPGGGEPKLELRVWEMGEEPKPKQAGYMQLTTIQHLLIQLCKHMFKMVMVSHPTGLSNAARSMSIKGASPAGNCVPGRQRSRALARQQSRAFMRQGSRASLWSEDQHPDSTKAGS